MEPPNKGHIETSHFVLCREVVLSLEVENVLVLWESEPLGPQEASFKERYCVLYSEGPLSDAPLCTVYFNRSFCVSHSQTHSVDKALISCEC